MRLVQVMVPAGKRQAIVEVLENEGVDYAMADETSGRKYAAIATFPLPVEAVEPVLESLREAGIERDAYTVVTDAETVVSRRYEDLEKRYEGADGERRIAREELVARADELAPDLRSYLVLSVMSAVVATAGLLLDSPAVVVGSMVIAPLVGPAMSTGVGTVVGDEKLFARGVRLQLGGGVLSVASAAGFAYLLHATGAVPMEAAEVFALDEVRERLAPDLLSLVVALAAGVAGAVSLSTGVSTALVGVMIAAALVPPTAVVGIGLAWGEPRAVVGSGVLVLVNFLAVNLATLASLWYAGYRPKRWIRRDTVTRIARRRAGALLLAMLLVSTFLVGVTYTTTRTASFEEQVRVAAADVVEEQANVTLLSVEVAYEGSLDLDAVRRLMFRRPERIVVTVGHPPGTVPPPLADSIAERVAAIAEETVSSEPPTVQVQYETVDTAGEGTTVPTPGPEPGAARTPAAAISSPVAAVSPETPVSAESPVARSGAPNALAACPDPPAA